MLQNLQDLFGSNPKIAPLIQAAIEKNEWEPLFLKLRYHRKLRNHTYKQREAFPPEFAFQWALHFPEDRKYVRHRITVPDLAKKYLDEYPHESGFFLALFNQEVLSGNV
jgi:hypothetical protein